jgi:hypothetical protein
MARTQAAIGSACGVLLVLCAQMFAQAAAADELPIRKPGLWEMKMGKAGAAGSSMTMQHCTDETTDRLMNDQVSPLAKQACAKQDLKKTATGYVSDSVCAVAGASIVSHTEISGDFNSAYTVHSVSHSDKGPGGKPLDTTTAIEAKWLGACKADQKPGDIVMPGGLKLNIKDMEKLKALIPGAK